MTIRPYFMTTNGYYVYILIDPRKPVNLKILDFNFNCTPYYVGKGSGRRWKKHFEEGEFKRPYNKHKNNVTKAILNAGFSIEDCIFMAKIGIKEEEALEYEKALIKEIGCTYLKNGPLTNKNEGGTNPKTNKMSWEEKFGIEKALKMKEALRKRNLENNPSKNRKTPYVKPILSEETLKKMSENASKKVIGISRKFEFTYFPSVKKAAEFLRKSKSSISLCASRNSPNLTTGEHTWFYEEDIKLLNEEEIIQAAKERFKSSDVFKKKVRQISLKTGEIINVFDSMSDAALEIFKSRKRAGDISAAIKAKRQCGGYFWSIEEKDPPNPKLLLK